MISLRKNFMGFSFTRIIVPIVLIGTMNMPQPTTTLPQADQLCFTTETNTKGFTYVIAYHNKWDQSRKQSRRVFKKHVGKLNDDFSVSISPRFKELFPIFANGTHFYSVDKKLLDEFTYKQEIETTPGPKPDLEDVLMLDDLEVGMSWAAEQTASRSKIKEDLIASFGEEDGQDLLNLAIYLVSDAGSMDSYSTWRIGVFLPSQGNLSGERISEILGRVTKMKIDDFFKRRHARRIAAIKDDIVGSKVFYALDSTSISTYSKTIPEASWGHAKRDPDLKQINYTFIVNQGNGEIVYAYAYDGSINDVSSLIPILSRLISVGFNLDDVVFVTDRGYSSILNVKKELDLDLRFIQGVNLIEDAIKKNFDRYRASLNHADFFNPEFGAYARTVEEPWTQSVVAGECPKKVWLHLYRYTGKDEVYKNILTEQTDRVISMKTRNEYVPAEEWKKYSPYILTKKTEGKDPVTTYQRNGTAIEQAGRYAGRFVIRTNETDNPWEALKNYHMRNVVEFDFSQFKNWVEGDRMRCTGTTYTGKTFLCTLAASIRLMMMHQAKMRATKKNPIPGNSMDQLFRLLKLIRAERRPNANAWTVRQLTKKQRDALALLGFDKFPKLLSPNRD